VRTDLGNSVRGERNRLTPAPFQLAHTPLERGITLLEASAGTGKTFTIAGLFLRLLVEERLSIDQILVVTFTEAATAELRGRIRERLLEARDILRAGESSDPVWTTLLLKGEATDFGERRACVEAALEQFDEAAVFTIHGFCQRVLQEWAFESRALFDAELTPDLTPFLRETADNFWRRHFYEVPARQVLFAHQAGVSADALFTLLRQHSQQAQVTVLARGTDRSWTAAVEEAEATFDQAARIWQGDRAAIRAHFGDSGGAWGNTPYNRSDLMEAQFSVLEALFVGESLPLDGLEIALQFGQSVLAEGRNKRNKGKKLEVPTHPFFVACDQLSVALDRFGSRMRYEFLTQAGAELARLKERDRRFGFEDLLNRVADTLSGPAGPALAGTLRLRYRAALIDEFQDTDPIQWQIFERVFGTGETFLHLVGDPKQAIYSFRGADVFAYLRARATANREFTLGENWRSERQLVRAVNQLFSLNPRPFALTEITFQPVAARGRADETPLTEAGERRPPLCVWFWDAPADGAQHQGPQQERLAEAVADEIVRLLSGDLRLGAHLLAPGDIAVLVDRHHEAETIAAALARRRVPSVQRTQQSVFATREAGELQALLEALVEGSRDGQRRAALATALVGLTARELDAFELDEAGWEAWLETLTQWSERWLKGGFLLMFETVLRERHTRGRLLASAEGERRLTNFLHLGEILQHAAAQERLTPQALLTWLAAQRGRTEEGEVAAKDTLLRLERDAAAVQLVTLHSSKGLEYPVVFCPFLTRKPQRPLAPVLFHDPADRLVLKHDVGTAQQEDHRRRMTGETFAENLRLLYVALTRAQHRCYLGWGRLKSSETSALAWLLHAPPEVDQLKLEEAPEALEEWVKGLDLAQRREALAALAGDAVEIRELPPLTTERWQPMELAAPPVAAREFRGQIRRDWGMASFSTLAHGRTEDLPDRDPAERPTEVAVTPPGPLALFRGTRAGTCLHEVFELLDFTQADPVTVQARVEERLRAHGFPPELLSSELTILVGRVLDAELFLGTALRRVPAKACWRELEFLLPLQRLTPASLRAAFSVVPRGGASDAFAASLGRLGFADIEGFLSGFMDLVFQHEGRWWLVDWKSNWLGDSPEAYGPEALEREMLGQHYGLQYHLYLLALHRLLRQRLPNYEYERDVGGAVYVFVRGVTPGRPELGLFRDRPPQRVLDELEVRLLGTSSPEVRR